MDSGHKWSVQSNNEESSNAFTPEYGAAEHMVWCEEWFLDFHGIFPEY